MLSKKVHADIKKSTQKVLDSKKDTATRFKHLKIVLDYADTEEIKHFFEAHYSHIYFVFYDCFITAESNLKQKIHKAHREELETVLGVLEKILLLLPDLISKRWQCHSLTRILSKLLHSGNSFKLRREAVKYFLIWYQVLGENCPDEVHAMYATLIPGLQSPFSKHGGLNSPHTVDESPVSAIEITPVYPPQSGDKQPDDQTRYFIDAILEFSVTQVSRIEWKDKAYKQHKCFNFLFDKFKFYYINYIFPNFNKETDIFRPKLDLPVPRNNLPKDPFLNCRVSVMKWVANFTHITKSQSYPLFGRSASITPSEHEEKIHEKKVNDSVESFPKPSDLQDDPSVTAFNIVRDILYSSRENVNFIHEVYRQCFLLSFAYSHAIRRAITVYKDWIQMNVAELPSFMLEPDARSGPPSTDYSSFDTEENQSKLRNDSYIGAIQKDNNTIKAGLQNVLQVFITDACNVFLYENTTETSYLSDQVDICKRVLNIYRYMVMHTHMDEKTWEQLLTVLLHVTSLVISPSPPKKKDCLSGRLAPAIFQTLIVTWIKANLNVVISSELWDQFLAVLSSLTRWEELIREWGKTMETLTRVLARHVYNLELADLPLDRLSEQKTKRRKGLVRKIDSCQNEADHPKSSITPSENDKRAYACSPLRRSVSETNIIKREISEKRTSIDCEDAMVEIKLKEEKINRKWKSMDSVGGFKVHHSCSYYGSGHVTRSPSPAPSSGVESNSFKESPIQIDVLNNETSESDGKSVMSGGTLRGWSPDAASILWLRMLGALGNINKIPDPIIHSHVFNLLVDLFDTLAKVRLNQGILEDSPQPEYVPPLTIFAPWCFQALSLPNEFHSGKLSAYRLLSNMTLMNHDIKLHPNYLTLFFTVLHEGLISHDRTVTNTLVKYCGPRFFSLQLPGFTILILDFVYAAKKILFSPETKGAPRSEAVSILGALLAFPPHLTSLPVLYPETEYNVKSCPNLKDFILEIILKCGKVEISGTARCIALSNLGIFIYRVLSKGEQHPKVVEAVNTILLCLKFNHNTVAQTAADILLLLGDHSEALLLNYPEIPGRIIEVLVATLSHIMPVGDSDKRLLTSLVFCLGEWTMRVPIKKLIDENLLMIVLKVLDELSEGGTGKGIPIKPFPEDISKGFIPTLTLDDLHKDLPNRGPFLSNPSSPPHLNSTAHSVQQAARLVVFHLVNNLGHFPLTSGGANLGSLVVEQDDVKGLEADQLSPQLFSSPYVQIFVSNQGQVVSLVEVPSLEVPRGGPADDLVSAPSQVRIILRDMTGKASWDASILYCTPDQISSISEDDVPLEVDTSSVLSSLCISSIPQHTLRHRPPHILPTYENSADDMDNLDDLLQYIGHTSPEVLESLDTPRNVPAAPLNPDLEQEAMGSILGMSNDHQEYASKNTYKIDYVKRERGKSEATSFQYCRLLFSQLGLYTWDHRKQLHLVEKNDKFLRELRNLDTQRCRQTHKIAVIYVAQGQQDKVSILSNSGGSQAYEQFIAGLAWEVELETHIGFMAGLQRNKATGVTAPYYATSFIEVMFHVSTRMPCTDSESLLQKTRHLGNDEVHIVWSEDSRDYRRGIIPTEFCDVLIVIYPLAHSLYRVQVSRKSDVPYFGPLYNEAIVGQEELPGLVRATALSASRAKCSVLPFYQQYYEERSRFLDTIVKNYKRGSTYEDFMSEIYEPGAPEVSSKPPASLQSMDDSASSTGSTHSSTLAALLDSSQRHPMNQVYDDSDDRHEISPRPLKKFSNKQPAPKRPSPTPPDSPTSRRSQNF